MKPEKRGIPIAVDIAADLFGDTEVIDTAFRCRTAPVRIRGSGIVVLTERALIAVDAHPSKENRSTRIEWPDVQSIAKSSGPGGVTLVVVLARTGRLELFAGSDKYGDGAQELIADLARFAETATQTPPRAVLANWWEDPTLRWPKKTALGVWSYLGGLSEPSLEEGMDNVLLELNSDGVVATRHLASEFSIPWKNVMSVAVEGPQQVERRVTATRLLTVGLFAFAWKKKQKSAFLVFELNNGDEALFESTHHTQAGLRALLAGVLSAARLAEATPPSSSPPASVGDRLRNLAALRDDGIISDDDFEAQKQRLLVEL